MSIQEARPLPPPATQDAHSESPAAVPAARPLTRVLMWHWGQSGAAAKFTFELAQELRMVPGLDLALSSARGSDLHALAAGLGLSGNEVPIFEGNKTTLRGKLAAALGLARLPAIARRFRRMLATHQAAVALCTFQSIWDAATLPILSRGPVRSILILHDAVFHPGDGYPLRYRVMCQQVRNTDALIVLSDHVRQQAIDVFDYPAERIWTMPHGAFKFGTGQARPAVHPRGSRPVRLLFFGRIVAYKGLDHLLRAMLTLRQEGVAVDLVIAGSGRMQPYAELLARLPGVTLHNRWLNDEEIAEFMAAADIAVLPYTEASQSGVAATAYAAGRPVVATPIGGLAEQVVHRATGLLARDMSVAGLADAIAELAGDPELFDRCAAGALVHARDELNWRRSAETVAAAINAVQTMPRRSKG